MDLLIAKIDTGDTAWMLIATALVLLMTPALGLFYAGLVRSKNTLNTFMMCVAAIAIATVTWAAVGYSLAFSEGGDLIGSLDYAFLNDVGFEPREGQTIPHLLFFAFQATFCIITTALIAGAVVERMRFGAVPRLRRAVVDPGLLGPRVLGLWRRLAHQRRHARLRRRDRRRDGLRLLGACRSAGRRGAQGLRAPGAPAAQRRLRAGRRRPAVVRLVRVQRRLRVQHRSELDARVHEHAAHAGVRADHVVRARPHPRADGDRDRRGDGDHRRLRPHHPGGRLHRPRLGDGARLRGSAALLRLDRLPAAHPRGRDARRPRRARPRRLHGNPRSSGFFASGRPGTGSPTAPSTGTSTSSSIRSWPRSRCPRTRSS